MKSAFCACLAVVAVLAAGALADAAQPSAAKLSQMGLSGATIVSNSVAMEVRGFGYRGSRSRTSTSIYGHSSAEAELNLGPFSLELESRNGYSHSGGSASGQNLSYVGLGIGGVETNRNGGAELDLHAVVAFAGGSSSVNVGGRNGH